MFANIENFIKDPKKAKNILQEKADLLQKGYQNIFGKKFRSHVVKAERSKKRTLEVLVEIVALLLLRKSPFGQVLQRTASVDGLDGDFTTVKNRTIETDITYNLVRNKRTMEH